MDNLHRTSLTPRSRYWRQSKLDYGKLLFQQAHELEQTAYQMRKRPHQRFSGLRQPHQGHGRTGNLT